MPWEKIKLSNGNTRLRRVRPGPYSEPTGPTEPEETAETTLEDLTKAELLEKAAAAGVEVPARATKAKIVEALGG